MNTIKEYQINTDGESNGLTIPSGFRIIVQHALIQSVQNDPVKNYQMDLQTATYKDDTHQKTLPNDNIPPTLSYTITAANLATAVNTLVDDNIRPQLDTAYGAENVTVIT